MSKIDIEEQYQAYLKRVELDEGKMHPQQKIETKRAFFGAWGQVLVVLNEDLNRIQHEEGSTAAEEAMLGMYEQVSEFWNNQK